MTLDILLWFFRCVTQRVAVYMDINRRQSGGKKKKQILRVNKEPHNTTQVLEDREEKTSGERRKQERSREQMDPMTMA